MHLTFDREGRVKFGPDVEWVDELSFSVDPTRADLFFREVRKFWPAFAGELNPDQKS